MFRKTTEIKLQPRKDSEPIKKNKLDGEVKYIAGRKRNIPKPTYKRT